MSDKRLVTFKVDLEVLDPFDAWCQAQAITRTDALVSYMRTIINPETP